jgi:transcription initiation factor TFIIIB Brf1 subunit/transcription initiation factor TFIIB
LPLERFTSERNALARELRRAGQRDAAAEVLGLRKPSVGAWAVNQLVRTQSRAIAELFRAGDALRKVQADLLAGRSDARSLRQAVESERSAVDGLVRRAGGLLTSDGHQLSPTALEQVSETLHAAAIDEQARATVRDGCLDRELRHVGLDALSGAAPARRGRASSRPQSSRKQPSATEEARQRRAERSAARQAEAQARRQLDRALRAEADAEERHHRAQRELREAEAALDSARETREQAMQAHARARETLDGLT